MLYTFDTNPAAERIAYDYAGKPMQPAHFVAGTPVYTHCEAAQTALDYLRGQDPALYADFCVYGVDADWFTDTAAVGQAWRTLVRPSRLVLIEATAPERDHPIHAMRHLPYALSVTCRSLAVRSAIVTAANRGAFGSVYVDGYLTSTDVNGRSDAERTDLDLPIGPYIVTMSCASLEDLLRARRNMQSYDPDNYVHTESLARMRRLDSPQQRADQPRMARTD